MHYFVIALLLIVGDNYLPNAKHSSSKGAWAALVMNEYETNIGAVPHSYSTIDNCGEPNTINSEDDFNYPYSDEYLQQQLQQNRDVPRQFNYATRYAQLQKQQGLEMFGKQRMHKIAEKRSLIYVFRRACLPRGANCEHRLNDCCYNSSCRCNLWGSNCRCQRMGLFQKWG